MVSNLICLALHIRILTARSCQNYFILFYFILLHFMMKKKKNWCFFVLFLFLISMYTFVLFWGVNYVHSRGLILVVLLQHVIRL